MPEDIFPVDVYCITIEETLLSSSFLSFHPTKMFSNTGKLWRVHKSKLQVITQKTAIAVFMLSDLQKSQVAKLWPCSWWFYGMVWRNIDEGTR